MVSRLSYRNLRQNCSDCQATTRGRTKFLKVWTDQLVSTYHPKLGNLRIWMEAA